jgi:glycosyltransferase involved in cell wall biosynthesis
VTHSKPRLVILCEYPTLLGGERSMLATLGNVAAAGFDIHVGAPPDGPLADVLRLAGVPHIPWQTHDAAATRFPLQQLRADLSAICQRAAPELVHANSLSTARIAGPVAAALELRSMGHLRDIAKLSPQTVADLNSHRRLIAVSRATRDFHVMQGIDAGRCVVAHNGVDLDRFCPRKKTGFLHRELKLPAAATFAAVIGQLGLRKGTDIALAAARQVASDLPDLYWLVIGERTSNKPESQDFEQLLHTIANEPPLAGRVHFLGRRDDVDQILPECALLVHAARQEPLGRVLLEAAACGLAIIATDVGGTREIFSPDTDTAVLVPGDNPSDIAAAVRALVQNESRRRNLGRAARLRAEAAFDIREASARLIGHYRQVLADNG